MRNLSHANGIISGGNRYKAVSRSVPNPGNGWGTRLFLCSNVRKGKKHALAVVQVPQQAGGRRRACVRQQVCSRRVTKQPRRGTHGNASSKIQQVVLNKRYGIHTCGYSSNNAARALRKAASPGNVCKSAMGRCIKWPVITVRSVIITPQSSETPATGVAV